MFPLHSHPIPVKHSPAAVLTVCARLYTTTGESAQLARAPWSCDSVKVLGSHGRVFRVLADERSGVLLQGPGSVKLRVLVLEADRWRSRGRWRGREREREGVRERKREKEETMC